MTGFYHFGTWYRFDLTFERLREKERPMLKRQLPLFYSQADNRKEEGAFALVKR